MTISTVKLLCRSLYVFVKSLHHFEHCKMLPPCVVSGSVLLVILVFTFLLVLYGYIPSVENCCKNIHTCDYGLMLNKTSAM